MVTDVVFSCLQVVDVANKYKQEKYQFAVADEEEFEKELAEVSFLLYFFVRSYF